MNVATAKSAPVDLKTILTLSLITAIYFAVSYLVVGFKPEQLLLAGLFNALYYLSAITRRFILGFAIFIVYWTVFDYMKAFPNYNFNAVHIADLYHTEKQLFSIEFTGTILTPNEYWLLNHNSFLDVISGLFYLCWIPVPLAFAAYLLFTRPRQFLLFSLTFFLVNLLGFVVYYVYPAAPPWYVQVHGFKFIAATPGNTGGLARFDHFFNAGIFKSIYAKGSNVFAAMPSLHSSYPVIVLYYGLKNRLKYINLFFALVMGGIWFSAVYASHHYILDVIAGVICAVTGIALFNLILSKSTHFKRFINNYERLLTP